MKAASTQTVVALSSGEPEFNAVVRRTATALGMESIARDERLKQIRYLDVVYRCDWVQGRFGTWTHGVCGCRAFSTGEKQPYGKSQESSRKQTV